MNRFKLDRRKFLTAGAAGLASVPLAGCEAFDPLLGPGHPVRDFMIGANGLTETVQRTLMGRDALAKEFSESEIRQGMRPNGSTNPNTMEYQFLRQGLFSLYNLEIDGLVDNPLRVSLEEMRNMPSRTQITRHDCVEGWSCIAKWTGVQLGYLLEQVGPQANANYCVFHCFDVMGMGLSGEIPYYESIDMIDAYHPQTILAYGMNDDTLPVENGAPLRLRVERQLGYKMAKYVYRIELVESFSHLHRGNGSYWADHGYEWYAGI